MAAAATMQPHQEADQHVGTFQRDHSIASSVQDVFIFQCVDGRNARHDRPPYPKPRAVSAPF
jgi:hypothetical protein